MVLFCFNSIRFDSFLPFRLDVKLYFFVIPIRSFIFYSIFCSIFYSRALIFLIFWCFGDYYALYYRALLYLGIVLIIQSNDQVFLLIQIYKNLVNYYSRFLLFHLAYDFLVYLIIYRLKQVSLFLHIFFFEFENISCHLKYFLLRNKFFP